MVKVRPWFRNTFFASLMLITSCSSSSSESADTETVQFQSQTVALEDLPEAEGRTAFAISDDAVIIGGGATGTAIEGHEADHKRYSAIHDLWLLDESGQAATLPSLDAKGIVQGLSGVQIDDVIVLGGQDCLDNIQDDFLSCWGSNHPVVWTMGPDDDLWERHEPPSEVTEGALWPGRPTGGGDMWVFGSFGGRAYISLTNDKVTRFLTFDPESKSFEQLGDGEAAPRNWTSAPYCLTDGGQVIQLRALATETEGLFELSPWNPSTEQIFATRLDPDGTWHSGPSLPLDRILDETQLLVTPPDLTCLPGEALVLLSPMGSTPRADDDDLGTSEVQAFEILLDIDARTLQMQEEPVVDRPDSLADSEASPGAITQAPDDDNDEWVIQMSGSSLYIVSHDGELSPIDEVPTEPSQTNRQSIFAYSGGIGTVNHWTGEVDV